MTIPKKKKQDPIPFPDSTQIQQILYVLLDLFQLPSQRIKSVLMFLTNSPLREKKNYIEKFLSIETSSTKHRFFRFHTTKSTWQKCNIKNLKHLGMSGYLHFKVLCRFLLKNGLIKNQKSNTLCQIGLQDAINSSKSMEIGVTENQHSFRIKKNH